MHNRVLGQMVFLSAVAGAVAVQSMSFGQDSKESADAKQSAAAVAEFERRDADKDGQLTIDEYLAERPDDQRAKAKRDFGVVDWDQNERLSQDEYFSLPGVVPLVKRTHVPDPVLDAAKGLVADLKGKWSGSDKNSDDILDADEFGASQIVKSVPGLETTNFAVWDLDKNGQLTLDEAVRVVDAAGGVLRPDGFGLRSPNGIIFDWMAFTYFDADGDDQLSAADLQKRRNLDAAVAEKQVASLDRNQDQQLSPDESRPMLIVDVLGQFLDFDRNLDGQLDREEWIASTPDWRSNFAVLIFRAFDANEDGQLSFTEFRWTTTANSLAAWHEARHDADGNGTLEPAEFSWRAAPALRSLEAVFFQKFDRNHDGHLDTGEFCFPTPRPNPKLVFQREDINGDGKLSLAEHQLAVEYHLRTAAARDFRLFDLNNDELWSLDEFRTVPGHAVVTERGSLPDPLVRLVETQFQKLKEKWSEADRGQNGNLDAQEFAASRMSHLVYGLDDVPFTTWDLNKDDRLTSEELNQVLRAAYGVARTDGIPLRWDSGVVVHWMGFKILDRNGDDRLDEDEFVKQGIDGAAAPQLFKDTDADQNGSISFPEWKHHPIRYVDVIAVFSAADRDFDGLLTQDELLAGTPEFNKQVASHVFPGFDTDKDDHLSLDEYRMTPLANLLEPWHQPKNDRDGDGLLTLTEFGWDRALDSRAITAEFFRRFDTSGDQRLDLDEYFFSTTHRNLKREFKKIDKDGDGTLSEDEFVATRDPKTAKRDFGVIDWDQNQRLSSDEYFSLPGVLPRELRTRVPDPVLDAAQAQIAELKGKWPGWDKNADGLLDAGEFTGSGLAKSVPGLEGLNFAVWDSDNNGQIAWEEAARLVELAFGVRQTGGVDLRSPTSFVFGWMAFFFFDADGDGFLSTDDMQKRMGLDLVAAEKRLASLDKDQDQKLSPDETRPLAETDTLMDFLTFDRSGDGRLDREEWIASTPEWRSNYAIPAFRAFDADGDGHLSFQEYRWTPPANLFVAWHEVRRDTDGNGTLEPNEFFWRSTPAFRSYEAIFFRKLDRNDDGRLDTGEFCFDTARPNPKLTFQREDLDGDGRLSLVEHQIALQQHERVAALRNFRLFDLDHDEFWTLDEFQTVPGHAVLAERGPLPDPLVRLVETQFQKMKAKWSEADRDQNGSLDAKEFAASRISHMIDGLEEVPFAAWDLNKDDRLTPEELNQAVRVAYGVSRTDEIPLRWESGVVANWMGFKALDVNRDDRLDEDECVKHGFDGAAGPQLFKDGDVDHNGAISFPEWNQQSIRHADIIAAFLAVDRDFDGLLTRDEVWVGTPDYQRQIASHVFPGFDTNSDGRLSLDEYRLTPLTNYQEAWHHTRLDRDGDGLLSLTEFGWDRELDSRAFLAYLFRRLDVSGDKRLDPDEYFFSTTNRDLGREFKQLDKDADGNLSETEFVASGDPKTAKRDFIVFDADADGRMTSEEFLSVASRIPVEKRLAQPDPVIGLARKQLAQLEPKFKAADKDGDGALSAAEFQRSGLARDVAGLQLTGLKDWDCDHNGSVSMNDVERFLDAAFGIRRLDGTPYREPSGIIHNAMNYLFADENHDDRISLKEYLERGFGGETAKDTFQQTDTDKNGYLSFQEWVVGPRWQVDPVTEFLRFDTDLDGHLSEAEIMTNIAEWIRPVAESYLPDFDADRDGKLSLAEYRLVPMINLLYTWHDMGSDRDGDGRLSFSEFHTLRGVEIVALAHEYFRRRDKNSDGKLDLNEHRFSIDPARVSPDIAFKYRDKDKDSHLTLDELLVDLKPQKGNPGAQVLIGRIEEAFRAADANGDKRLSLSEFQSENGRRTVNPVEPPRNTASTKIARNAGNAATGGPSGRFMALVAINIVLIGGVAWYVLFKK